MSVLSALLLCLSLIAQGISGQLTGATGGLDSDACVNETRTMKEIISGGREASGGFFQGGLGGNAHGDWETYGCWRKHACLDALNAAGIDTAGDAICYKFNSVQHSWLLWGLQSSLNLQCSSDRAPGVGGDDAEDEHGVLWGFPLTAPRVKYVSNYSFPLAELSRTLTPIAGYDAGTAKFSTIDISNHSHKTYRGGILGPDGKIYFVPHNQNNIGVYDPSTGSFSKIDISSQNASSHNYYGGVLGPDGKLYFVPYSSVLSSGRADNIGVYDPSTGSFSTIDISSQISTNWAYIGGVLGPDGKIVFAPADADNIGVYDPSSPGLSGGLGSFWTIDISSHISITGKYYGGVLGPDGKIYFVPHQANNIGVYDPSIPGSSSFSTIDISMKISHDIKYRGGVLGPDGKLYFVPYDANNIGVYDPSTPGPQGFSTIDLSSEMSIGGHKYCGGVLGPDGKLYFVPHKADNIGVYDPSILGPQGFSTINLSTTGNAYKGTKAGILGPDGKIYFVPYYFPDTIGPGNIGVLDIGNKDLAYEVSGGIPEALSALLSPHFNKF